MPKKVDDSGITRKVVKSLLADGPASTRKLARVAGTTSPKKIRQIAKIASIASYYLADRAMKEISKLPLEDDVRMSVEKALMIPRVIEVKDAPDMVALEPMTVAKARISITPEVEEAVSRSGVVPNFMKTKHVKAVFSKKLKEKARAKVTQ